VDQSNIKPPTRIIRVAVASYEGILVNQHLGMADSLLIFEDGCEGCRLVDRRRTPPHGSGDERWEAMARLLSDCQAILSAGAGQRPVEVLTARGLKVYEVEGLIEDALAALYQGKELRMPHRSVAGCRRTGTQSAGGGCG
jgi:nitrogen fixation protein NifB